MAATKRAYRSLGYEVPSGPEAQNADRDVRPTDAEAKESKNASSCQKSPSTATLGTFESHSIDTDDNSARLV